MHGQNHMKYFKEFIVQTLHVLMSLYGGNAFREKDFTALVRKWGAQINEMPETCSKS
jgi:hypothetical protein